MKLIYTDGFFVWSYTSRQPRRMVGIGYTLCDHHGKVLKREFRNCENVYLGMIDQAELWGIMAAISIASPNSTIVTDSRNALYVLEFCQIYKVSENVRDNFLRCYLKMKDTNIKVVWETRENNLAGKYNESFQVRRIDLCSRNVPLPATMAMPEDIFNF